MASPVQTPVVRADSEGFIEFLRTNRKGWTSLVALALGWWAFWTWTLRYHQLDDAFITLRYAQHLVQSGELAFNPHLPSRGNSSLLYTYVVALVYSLYPSPLDTKFLSVMFDAILSAAIFFRFFRAKSDAAAALWLALLVVILSPMGFRWLTDGMETSFHCLLAYAIACSASATTTYERPWPRFALLTILGLAAVLLRVEASLLVASASIGLLVRSISSEKRGARAPIINKVLSASHLSVGAMVGLAIVILKYGAILPDTAAAKSVKSSAFTLGHLIYFAHAVGGSFTLGIGLIVLAAGSAALAYVAQNSTGEKLAILAGNLPFPTLWLVAWSRGQEAQIRYFLASLIFAIVWNLTSLDKATSLDRVSPRQADRVQRWVAPAIAGFLMLAILAYVPETARVYHIGETRAHSFLAMRSEHLEALASSTGVAAEIGMIGFFSQAQICDIGGLVGGRDWAAMRFVDRIKACAERSPAFVFANAPQIDDLRKYLDIDAMKPCFNYPLPNVSTEDVHTLYVDRKFFGILCK